MKSGWILIVVILSLNVQAIPTGVYVTNSFRQVIWLSFYGKNYQSFERDHYEPIELERHEIGSFQSVFIPFGLDSLKDVDVDIQVTFSNIGFHYICLKSKAEKQPLKLVTQRHYELNISSEYGYWPEPYLICSVRECN